MQEINCFTNTWKSFLYAYCVSEVYDRQIIPTSGPWEVHRLEQKLVNNDIVEWRLG